jgi:hypothetical protein
MRGKEKEEGWRVRPQGLQGSVRIYGSPRVFVREVPYELPIREGKREAEGAEEDNKMERSKRKSME